MPLKPFPKGVSGNPGGRRKKPLIDKWLEECLVADDSKTAKQLAEKLVSMAAHGSLAALKLIAERTEGRPMRSPSDGEQKTDVKLTPEQVDRQLAELLKDRVLKERLARLMAPNAESVQ